MAPLENKLTTAWFENHINKSIKIAGPRYTPELNVELPIAEIFDGLGRTKQFYKKIGFIFGEIKRSGTIIAQKTFPSEAKLSLEKIQNNLNSILSILTKVNNSKIKKLNFKRLSTLSEQTSDMVWELYDLLQSSRSKEAKSKQLIESDPFPYERYHLSILDRNLRQLHEFSISEEAQLANKPLLLLTGNAGIGKTHLLCDIAKYRIKNDLPTILILGEKFVISDPWNQIINLSKATFKNKQELLSALNENGKAKSTRSLVIIDALNEGSGRIIWKKHIKKIVADIKKFPYIALAVSVRTGFATSVFTKKQIDLFIRIEHSGFQYNEWEAANKFFKHYKIKLPDIPFLIPEFQTPLFLKLFCQTYEGKEEIDRGHLFGTNIFEDYVIKMGNKICKKLGLLPGRRNKGKNFFWDNIIKKVAEWMGEKGRDTIHKNILLKIIEEAEPGKSDMISDAMEKEWLLTKMPIFNKKGSIHSYYFRFPYNKFSDHLIVRYLLNNHLEPHKNDPKEPFKSSKKLGKLIFKSWNYGLLNALSVQVPERLNGIELLEIAPVNFKKLHSAKTAFIESLIWRNMGTDKNGNPKFIKINTIIKIIKKNLITDRYLYDKFRNVLFTVASIPGHPLNARFLHSHLMKFSLPDRDYFWTIFLNDQFGNREAVDRLIEWAWFENRKKHICDEAILLSGIALSWLLISSNRHLRDRSTKAIVKLFTNRLHLLRGLLKLFIDVNDPYLLERLYAATYGSALRNSNKKGLQDLAQFIYEKIFKNGNPPPHVLLRDYARGVIDVALNHNINLKIDSSKINPPYKSECPRKIPTKKYLKSLYDKHEYFDVWYSVMDFGDFARYIIGTNNHMFEWSNRLLKETQRKTRKEKYDEFLLGLNSEQRQMFDKLHLNKLFKKVTEKNQLKEDLKETNREGLIREEKRLTKKLDMKLSQTQSMIFRKFIIPYLNNPIDETLFDLSIAQRWIFKRAIDLGWSPDLFGQYDKSIARYKGEQRKERIGKKYQWIAYHEFLARVSDNYEYIGQDFENKIKKYEGPWQLRVRDIDPSCLIKSRPNQNIVQTKSWIPISSNDWAPKKENKFWIKNKSQLPNPNSLIDVLVNNQNYFLLGSFFEWEEKIPPQVKKYEFPTKRLTYRIKSFLFKNAERETVINWVKEQNFLKRSMPENGQFYITFLNEYPWAKAFTYFNTHSHGRDGWTDRNNTKLPAKLLITTDRYLREIATRDCSNDESIHITLPSKWICDEMGLKHSEIEGEFKDSNGNVIACDPSIRLLGPTACLILKDKFINFLENEDLSVFWTIIGEKNIIGGVKNSKERMGRLEINGAFWLRNTTLEGKIDSEYIN